MNLQFYWYSRHKTAVVTVARFLSVEISELLVVLDKKIKQKKLKAMYASSYGNNRKLNITVYNHESYIVSNDDEWLSRHRNQKKTSVSV